MSRYTKKVDNNLKKILLCTHGDMANGMINSLELITGGVVNVSALSVNMEDTIDFVRSKIEDFINSCELEDDKIILTDIPGGSTTQASFYYINTSKRVHVITGLNLGLLLEIYLSSEEDIVELLKNSLQAAKETLNYLNSSYEL